jgi:hypothetical protein
LKASNAAIEPSWYETMGPTSIIKKDGTDKEYSFSNSIVTFATVSYNRKRKCWENESNIRGSLIFGYSTVEEAQKQVEAEYKQAVEYANRPPIYLNS